MVKGALNYILRFAGIPKPFGELEFSMQIGLVLSMTFAIVFCCFACCLIATFLRAAIRFMPIYMRRRGMNNAKSN